MATWEASERIVQTRMGSHVHMLTFTHELKAVLLHYPLIDARATSNMRLTLQELVALAILCIRRAQVPLRSDDPVVFGNGPADGLDCLLCLPRCGSRSKQPVI